MVKSKIVYIFGFSFFIFLIGSTKSYALDLQILQEQCADIGFKIKTPANGKCVLQLMQTVKNKEAQGLADQRAYDSRVAAVNAQRQQEATMRQQQAEMYELQRRSVAAQEQAAKAQTDAADNQGRAAWIGVMNQGLDRMTGTGAYAPRR